MLIGIIITSIFYIDSKSNVTRFYSNDYKSLVTYILEHPATEPDSTEEEIVDSDLNEEGESDGDGELTEEDIYLELLMELLFFISSAEEETGGAKSLINYQDYSLVLNTNPNLTKAISIAYKHNKTTTDYSWSVEWSQSADSYTATVYLDYTDLQNEENNYMTSFDASFDGSNLIIDESEPQKEQVEQMFHEAFLTTNLILQQDINENYTLENLLSNQRDGFAMYSVWYLTLYVLLFLFPVAALVFVYLEIKKLILNGKAEEVIIKLSKKR